ncbi:hypothetical protein [Streptomyces fulvoviolaceus]|uniref:hypothetical protein n=1 Tax=Streptomyces fulvoviolaceus TaxID=285535 RepID=UPI0004C69224|nr:hypothetical protein [Streptomyces fulvoviolaceus]MCT9083229.1 hypothetical protein [Streptomyces fulvoviolaceus]
MDWNQWSAVAGLSSAGLALAAVGIAMQAHRTEHRRSRFETARSLLHELTAGEGAAARNYIARLHYGLSYTGTSPDLSATAEADLYFAAYYMMLWSFERVEAGRTSLLAGGRADGGDEVIRYLDERLAWHVAEYACAIPQARARLGIVAHGGAVKDRDSVAGFLRLLSALQARGIVDRAFLPDACPGGAVCPCECHR